MRTFFLFIWIFQKIANFVIGDTICSILWRFCVHNFVIFMLKIDRSSVPHYRYLDQPLLKHKKMMVSYAVPLNNTMFARAFGHGRPQKFCQRGQNHRHIKKLARFRRAVHKIDHFSARLRHEIKLRFSAMVQTKLYCECWDFTRAHRYRFIL